MNQTQDAKGSDEADELMQPVKTAKAIHTFLGYRKPKNIQYVTTLEEDVAAIQALITSQVQAICNEVIGEEFTKDSIKPKPNNWVLHYALDGYHYTDESRASFANALITMQRQRLAQLLHK